MPHCSYCGASFSDEDAYLEHLAAEHRDEVGPIDRRRINAREETRGGNRAALAIGGLAILLLLAGGALLFLGGDDDPEPTYDAGVHVHGTMSITIEGEELPLSESSEFVVNDEIFHFHGNEKDRYGVHVWHIHGTDVTVRWALGTLGIDVNDDGTRLEYAGETYDDDDPTTTVEIRVNGEPVAPGSAVLDGVGPMDDAASGEGDDVVVTVTTEDE